MLEWRELSGRAMLSEWQGDDRAEDEEAIVVPSCCSVEVEPMMVEQPAVTVEERDALDDIELFLDKRSGAVRSRQTTILMYC